MARFKVALVLAVFAMLLTVAGADAQEETEGALLLIMDASGSMNEPSPAGGTRLDEAKDALRTLVSELPAGSEVGFRVYGHRIPQSDRQASCRDTELIVPVGPLDQATMISEIDDYEAKGYTPIGYSLEQGAGDLPPEGPRTIVLVSDGEDTCGNPPPCEAARELESQGVDLTVETVGFAADQKTREQLQCVAEATGGEYRDASNAAELADSLTQLSARALRTFTASGEQVIGGPSSDEAPIIEPGTYTDTILADEALWYAVELEEGQELRARATAGGFSDIDPDLGSTTYLQMTMYNPLNEEILDPGSEDQSGAGPTAVTVGNSSGTVDSENLYANEPGPYYVQVSFENRAEYEEMVGREFPLELQFDVTGEAAQAQPTTSEPQDPPPDDSSSSGTTSPDNDADTAAGTVLSELRTLALVVLVTALITLPIGIVLGIVIMRRFG